MPFLPSPGVASATIVAKWNAVIDIRTVWHVEKGGDGLGDPFNADELEDAGNRVSGAFSLLLPSVASAYVASEIIMRDLSVEAGAQVSYPTAITGGFAGANTGPYEGPVVSWLTGTAGRHNGRTFLPGISEADVDANGMVAGGIAATLKTRADSALTFLRAATDVTHLGAPLELVVLAAGLEPPNLFRVPRLVIGTRVRTEVGIQRRRRISR